MKEHLLRVLLILPLELPSATIYIVKPLRELARQGKLIFNKLIEPEVTVAAIRASDVVLFCRNSDPAWGWILDECLAQNIPIVYDLDDNSWEVPLDLYYARLHRAPERIRQLERFLASADYVRVYSTYLQRKIQPLTSRTCLVTPCIDVHQVRQEAITHNDDRVRITYLTGRGGGDALISIFTDALKHLQQAYPNRIEMYWWGEIPAGFKSDPHSHLVDVIHDYDGFLEYISQAGFDIGLAPLTASSFNLSKTNTKYRDYAAAHIAGVYSKVEVYTDCVQDELTGLLVENTPEAWFAALARLVEDKELRRFIQDNAFQYVVQNYRQELVEQEWLSLLGEIAGRSPQRGAEGVENTALARISQLDEARALVSHSAREFYVDLTGEQPADLSEIFQEIQRIAVGGGSKAVAAYGGTRICIAAPYTPPGLAGEQDSIPEKKMVFNEWTPQRWTAARLGIYPRLGLQPAPEENLANGRPTGLWPAGVDVRCYRVEFLYEPEFLNLPEERRRALRQKARRGGSSPVCDTIVYHALLVDGTLSEQEWDALQRQLVPVDVPELAQRALLDDTAALKLEQDRLLQTYHHELGALRKTAEQQAAAMQVEIDQQKADLDQLRSKLAFLERQAMLGRVLARDLDALRNRKILRIVEHFLDRSDLGVHLGPAMQRMRDDSLIFQPSLAGYRLQLSRSLYDIPFLAYRLQFLRPNLTGIQLAPAFDLMPGSGVIGIEVVSGGRILAQVIVAAERLEREHPVQFTFPAIAETASGYFELRVFTRDMDVPLRLYEWRKVPLAGMGIMQRKPFCGLDFAGES